MFWTSTKICPKIGPKTNDNFSGFAKHRLLKQMFCCNPQLHQKIGVFLAFLKQQTLVLTKKNTTYDKKTMIRRKAFEIYKTRQENQKQQKGLMKTNSNLNILMLFFSWNERKETRQRNKETKNKGAKERQERKKEEERKERRERERERERQTDIERESENGEGKKLGINKGTHWKINKNALF